MRRVFGLLAVLGLMAAISPTTVAAAAPIRDSLSMTGIRCDSLVTDAGLVGIYTEGAEAYLSLTTSGDPEAPPDIMSELGMASFDGSRLSADFDLVFADESENPDEPPTYTPAGGARLEAVLTPYGDLEDFSSDPQRIGNTWERRGFFSQLLSAEGTLHIDLLDGTNVTAELTGCGAGTVIQTVFVTNPNAFVVGGNQRLMECRWTIGDASVHLVAQTDDFGTNLTALTIVDGDRLLLGLTTPDFGATSFGATFDLVDFGTKGEIVGSATADADLTRSGERINDQEWVDNMRFSLVGDVLTVDGTLSITVDGTTTSLSMDDAACDATDLRVRVIEMIQS